MPNIQDIWEEIEEHKKEQKEIRAVYAGMLENAPGYEDVLEDLKTAKARKKQIETGVQAAMDEKMTRLEFLKHEIGEKKQLLADLALKNLLSGQRVEVRGRNDAEYEPLFAVRFRKRT